MKYKSNSLLKMVSTIRISLFVAALTLLTACNGSSEIQGGDQLNQGTENLPGEGTENQPDEDTEEQPTEGTENQPDDDTEEQPTEGTENQPDDDTEEQPTEGTENQPGDDTEEQPGEDTETDADTPNADLYLIIGQSNSAGRDTNFDHEGADAPSSEVLLFTDGNTFVTATQPLNEFSGVRKTLEQGVHLCLLYTSDAADE